VTLLGGKHGPGEHEHGNLFAITPRHEAAGVSGATHDFYRADGSGGRFEVVAVHKGQDPNTAVKRADWKLLRPVQYDPKARDSTTNIANIRAARAEQSSDELMEALEQQTNAEVLMNAMNPTE
jgi:hypothetical protein